MSGAQLIDRDGFQEAMDKVAACKIDPATWPHDPPLAFRHAAVGLLNEVARLRFGMDGGDLTELDELDLEDEAFVIDLNDLREFTATFHAEGNQQNYAACAAVFDWAMAAGLQL